MAAEPSEVRFRNWLLLLGLLVGPPLLLVLYYKVMFPGLVNGDALDFAQLGRNMSSGRGFITYVLRPLTLVQGVGPLRQPDTLHGPLFPFFQALGIGALGAKDAVAAGVSGLFYLLTIPVLYLLGTRLFNRTVGVVAALIFATSSMMLEYAISGLPITLYVFLTTALMLVLHRLAGRSEEQAASGPRPLPKGQLVLAGVLTAALYLTDPIFFWLVPVIFGAVLWVGGDRRVQAALWFALPLCVMMLPWMARNAALTGNAVFGHRGYELWMYTDLYPDTLAYRMTRAELIPGAGLLQAIIKKVFLNVNLAIAGLPQVHGSWLLAFFLPGLFFRFTDTAANRVRSVLLLSFGALLFGTLLFTINLPLFVAVVPGLLVFAVAYLLHLFQQAQLPRRSVALVTALLAVVLVYPLFADLALVGRPAHMNEVTSAKGLALLTKPGEVSLSDQPALAAWYGDRPSLLIPATDARVKEVKEQTGARWLFLTQQVRGYSPAWETVYNAFAQWNAVYAQARTLKQSPPQAMRINGQGGPLLEALDGFTTVQPPDDTDPTAIVATQPTAAPKVGMKSESDAMGQLAHNPDASEPMLVK